MVLQFNKQDDKWVAEATVNNDYALHIEKNKGGFFEIYQRSTSEGEYDNCKLPSAITTGNFHVLDYVFCHGYYPMNLKFISYSKVTKAELNEIQS